jgi:hypothetical protein
MSCAIMEDDRQSSGKAEKTEQKRTGDSKRGS